MLINVQEGPYGDEGPNGDEGPHGDEDPNRDEGPQCSLMKSTEIEECRNTKLTTMELPKNIDDAKTRLKNFNFSQYIAQKQYGIVSNNRRYELKLAMYKCIEMCPWDFNEALEQKLIYHLCKIIDCTNDKALFIINFIESEIQDTLWPVRPAVCRINIVYLYSTLRYLFEDKKELEPLCVRTPMEDRAEDLLVHLQEWFNGIF
ncbi:unnamed protein product [Mytilus coruscus]|uniref:Uncharacterized protein n=1 Tax=Mytilus coruscus TaxID=42192 RepID=A0A6J8C0E2_MYTCO|nr:unnamed protein product [Mytilus coruscus]